MSIITRHLLPSIGQADAMAEKNTLEAGAETTNPPLYFRQRLPTSRRGPDQPQRLEFKLRHYRPAAFAQFQSES